MFADYCFLDVEIGTISGKICDIGSVKEDGSSFHSISLPI